MIGIAFLGKIDPCLTHLFSKRAGAWTSTGHGIADFCVVKAKAYLRAVKSHRAPVENRRLPGKPIKIGRRLAKCSLQLGLLDGRCPYRGNRDDRKQLERVGIWMP